MTDEELRQYAATLVLDHARNVEYLTVHEMAEDHVDGGEISDDDASKVMDLILGATVTVTVDGVEFEDQDDADEADADPAAVDSHLDHIAGHALTGAPFDQLPGV